MDDETRSQIEGIGHQVMEVGKVLEASFDRIEQRMDDGFARMEQRMDTFEREFKDLLV